MQLNGMITKGSKTIPRPHMHIVRIHKLTDAWVRCDTLEKIFTKRVFLVLHIKKRMKGGKQKDPQDLQYGMSTVKVNNED